MALKLYKCMNVGNCSNADSGKTFDLPELGNPLCPECSEANVIAVRPKSSVPPGALLVAAVLAIGASGLGAYFYWAQAGVDSPSEVRKPDYSNEIREAFDLIYRDGRAPAEAEVRRLANQLAQKFGVDADMVLKLASEVSATYDQDRADVDRAMAFAQKGEYGQAATVLDNVVRRRPAHAWALANLCTAYLRLGRRADALTACDQAVRSGPGNWLAHYNMATVRVADGQKNEALKELQIALELVAGGADRGMTRTELVKQMKADAALSVLRNDPSFSKLTQLQ